MIAPVPESFAAAIAAAEGCPSPAPSRALAAALVSRGLAVPRTAADRWLAGPDGGVFGARVLRHRARHGVDLADAIHHEIERIARGLSRYATLPERGDTP